MKTKIIALLFILVLTLSGCGIYNDMFDKSYLKGTHSEYEALHTKSIGDIDYDNAIMYFETGYYAEAVEFCANTRKLYSESIVGLNVAYAYYEISTTPGHSKLQELKLEYLNITKDIVWNKYEACEYLETASRLYSNEDMEGGNAQIEMANTKIIAHDDLIPKSNILNSKIEVLEE